LGRLSELSIAAEKEERREREHVTQVMKYFCLLKVNLLMAAEYTNMYQQT
jgi:hypothetical protein